MSRPGHDWSTCNAPRCHTRYTPYLLSAHRRRARSRDLRDQTRRCQCGDRKEAPPHTRPHRRHHPPRPSPACDRLSFISWSWREDRLLGSTARPTRDGDPPHPRDRITMGGVRGDVIALGFIQTKIMEMGQPPAVQEATLAIWIQSRQYTGRIVAVSNARIFDEPVYNYTIDFPFIWEELDFSISLSSDRVRAEEIILAATERHTTPVHELGEGALLELQRRYFLRPTELGPRVYYRLTDRGLQLTVRFIVEDNGARGIKDAMNREILTAFEDAGIELATATLEIVRLPPVELQRED